MKNVVIWRFHAEGMYPAFVKMQNKGVINITAWYGDTFRCSYCTHDIFSMIKRIYFKSEYHPYDIEVYDKVYASIFRYVSMHSPKRFKPIDEYINLFNVLFNHFYHVLTSGKVDLVFFSFIPHQGPEKILYEVAKALNIKTVMVYQSIFPNKFLYLYDVDDFGDWFNLPIYQPVKTEIEQTYQKELFYMQGKKWRMLSTKDWEKLLRSFRKIPVKFEQVDLIETILSQMTRWKRNIVYRRNLDRHASVPDLNQKFVYFPLHLQPELSTISLGGIFVDQILAIERLHDIIPDDWFIYVKDNPKQNSIMRTPLFFERLRALKKVRLVPTKTNTYTLLENCLFVATITGTAGWEAISGGKNALLFGRSWYRNLPGVFSYHQGMDLYSILNYKIDHAELELKLGELMSKMADGVTDMPYAVIVKDFNPIQNIRNIESLFTKIVVESSSKYNE
jgi:hypothetical protein